MGEQTHLETGTAIGPLTQAVDPAITGVVQRLFETSQGPRTLDIAVVGEQGRGTEHRRSRQRQHDRADSQKNILKPHLKQQWVIPPKANSTFVAAMEDVLAVYTRPRDPDIPLVCLDDKGRAVNCCETRSEWS